MVSVAEAIAALALVEAPGRPKRSRSAVFYSSLAWRRLRYKVLAENAERYGGVARCELCGAVAAAVSPLNVDHIEPLSKRWDLRLVKSNLQVLCGECNHGKLDGPPIDFRKAEAAI